MTVHRAKRTPSDKSVSGWYAVLPAPGPHRELEGDSTADWVVIGAGFAGVAAARRLSELRGGDRIVLIDAQRVGWGAAGRNSGFMIDLPHELQSEDYGNGREADLKQIRLNRAGIAYVRDAVETFGLHDHFNPCGKYHGATNGSGMKALASFGKHLDSLGEPYTTLSASDMKDITGTDYYAGGMHTPGAAIIQPAGLIRGMADAIRGKVEIFENSPVTEIERPADGGGDIAVRTPRGSVRTKRLILSLNGQLESFGFYERRLLHIFTFASMTRPMDSEEAARLGGHDEWGLIPADPMGSTVRRCKDGRIVVRNTFTFNPSMDTSDAQIARIAKDHDRSFRARFPMLGEIPVDYRWGGHLCLSLNSVPVFGEIEKGIYAACCHNGLGTVKGTLAGKLAADLAAGSNEPLVAELQAYDKPAKLPPEPFLGIGARLRLWWAKVHAGSDF